MHLRLRAGEETSAGCPLICTLRRISLQACEAMELSILTACYPIFPLLLGAKRREDYQFLLNENLQSSNSVAVTRAATP